MTSHCHSPDRALVWQALLSGPACFLDKPLNTLGLYKQTAAPYMLHKTAAVSTDGCVCCSWALSGPGMVTLMHLETWRVNTSTMLSPSSNTEKRALTHAALMQTVVFNCYHTERRGKTREQGWNEWSVLCKTIGHTASKFSINTESCPVYRNFTIALMHFLPFIRTFPVPPSLNSTPSTNLK